MKKRIKDLTEEELQQICAKNSCGFQCPLYQNNICTIIALKAVAGTNFFDREVYIPQPHILDKQEHDYLRAVCKPFEVVSICKNKIATGDKWITICTKSRVYCGSKGSVSMPFFTKDTMYKGMEVNKEYTIQELELDKEREE